MSSCTATTPSINTPQPTSPTLSSSQINAGYPFPSSESQPTNVFCVKPNEVRLDENETVCVEGVVVSAYINGNDFVMEFDKDNQWVYAVSHNAFYLGIQGQCAKITGIVQRDNSGRFFVRSDLPGQVVAC